MIVSNRTILNSQVSRPRLRNSQQLTLNEVNTPSSAMSAATVNHAKMAKIAFGKHPRTLYIISATGRSKVQEGKTLFAKESTFCRRVVRLAADTFTFRVFCRKRLSRNEWMQITISGGWCLRRLEMPYRLRSERTTE